MRLPVVAVGLLALGAVAAQARGQAWLEFKSLPQPDGQTLLTQTAFFEPKGLFGLLYWYALYPVHALIFSGLIRRIGEQAC